jgi:hypothetical protein
MTPDKNQVVEIKQVNDLEFGRGGQNKKDVKMKVSPAMSFGINTTGQLSAPFFVGKWYSQQKSGGGRAFTDILTTKGESLWQFEGTAWQRG